ncbi:hypothetical protein ARMGADRAFT_1085254 [Armillaria gallica]|uniref:Uncharacterized protein n=1 Tax=Armillaria gallica TaxID=47427 RepID=A0A2H3DAM9_ARMGA|nr:hypothetical protein ARMGADRAFT_1085254 [Armillaria gallica]
MPHPISTKMTTKMAHFADSPNDTYSYGTNHLSSPVATCSSQRLLHRPPTSQYHHSQSLNDTPSPEYNNSLLPSLPSFSSPEYSTYSSLIIHTVLPLSSSSSWPLSTQPPPTPDGLRHQITLLPVKENFPETSTIVDIHDSLRPPCLSIDLSQDISPYILTLRDKPNMSPQDLPDPCIKVPSMANSHITMFG